MRLSKIDDKLSIYKEHKIIIWGTGCAGRYIHHLLSAYGIKTSFFCDNNPALWTHKIEGIDVISPEEAKATYSNDFLIQIGSSYETEIEKQLLDMGMDNYISYTEAKIRLINLKKYQFFKDHSDAYDYYLEIYRPKLPVMIDYLNYVVHPCFDNNEAALFALMPPKTGDVTLAKTTKKYAVHLTNLIHSTVCFTDKLRMMMGDKPIKFVTATREPIGQNLSSLYEAMDEELWDTESYWKDGGDLNSLYRIWIESNFLIYKKDNSELENGEKPFFMRRKTEHMGLVQLWFDQIFKERLNIDLLQYPFNKEQGYDIIKVDNMEIFIYQLERLNDIYPKLFEFLNINDEDAHLIMGNVAEDKWYSTYYKKATQEIQFSKEYFDSCYNTPYVKHFYSDEDIEKFKNKWKSHIK